RDAEVALAAFEQGFKLRIAFEARDHVAHFGADGPVAGIIARRVLALPGLLEFPEPFDKMDGAQFGVLAHPGFQLQRTFYGLDPTGIARSGLRRKLGVPLIDSLGIMGAVRP